MRSSRPTRKPLLRRQRPGERPSPIPRSSAVWELDSSTPQHTDRLGLAIGLALKGGETLALFGPLGAGKTALIRGIAKGLGATDSKVSSPTFVFIHEYRGRLPLAHIDLYRTDSAREIESIGLEEYWSGNTVVAIEWADKGLRFLPNDRLEIELRHKSIESRTIRLLATGSVAVRLLRRAKALAGDRSSRPSKQRARAEPKNTAAS